MDKHLILLEKNTSWIFIKKYLSTITSVFLIVISALMITTVVTTYLNVEGSIMFFGIDIFSIIAQILTLILSIILTAVYSAWYLKTSYKDKSNFIKSFFNHNCYMFEVIHISQENKGVFKINYWLSWWFSIILMLCSATMFYYYGLSWDPELQYLVDPQAVGFLIFGIIEIILALAFTSVCAIFVPIFYKESRDLYFKTQDYKNKLAEISALNLEKIPFKTLKQHYLMGFIPKNFYVLQKRIYKKNKNVRQ